ncbi:SMP-30/gluconolactonase/LRE family protein [Kordiimonas aquimaris]|uniref:SMP-30/gluconolactonase/LRE family protein n=1 Tax=Kordiimonas aquimaris TaxID=707591 RepID=UPI0021CE0F32|nr:SMP-30/gluconolactonase/LRE family protein [Kordiimonas aquimaris]
MRITIILTIAAVLYIPAVTAQVSTGAVTPTIPEVFVDEPFRGTEGLTFNNEGRLFVSGNRAVWEIMLDGTVRKLTDLDSNLGLVAFGERDILAADFGPTNAFRHQRNNDGVVWRITPEGDKTPYITGLGDPNALVVRDDGSVLVSDDATNEIFVFDEENGLRLFTTAVNHPNGIVLSHDRKTLYVAQIFKSIRPVIRDDSLWAIALGEDGNPLRVAPKRVARTGPMAANDGLAIDREGRIYIAANGAAGEVWRYDPETEQVSRIAANMPGAASLAFGRGEFGENTLYVTTTFSGDRGGKIYRIEMDTKTN